MFEKPLLRVSWINETVRLIWTVGSTVQGRWVAPDPTPDFDSLRQALREGIRQAGFTGYRASFVISSNHLAHQMVEVPPAKPRAIERYLARKVAQSHTTGETAVWGYHRTMPTLKGEGALLDLFPKGDYQRIDRACREVGLHLYQVVTPVTLLKARLRELPLAENEPALLVAEADGQITLVGGNREGAVLFTRSFRGSLGSSPERIAKALSHSVSSARQQFGATIRRVWVIAGDGSIASLEAHLSELTVETLETADPFDMLTSRAMTPAPRPENLVPLDIQQELKTRWMARVTTAALILFLGTALSVTGLIEWLLRQETDRFSVMAAERVSLEQEQQELRDRKQDLIAKEEAIDRFVADQDRATGARLLGLLAKAIPSELLLTQAELNKAETAWQVSLQGRAIDTESVPPEALARFKKGLEGFSPGLEFEADGAETKVSPRQPNALHPSKTFTLHGQIQ